MSNYDTGHELTVGQTDATRQYTIRENGSAKNLTGFTAVSLIARKRGETTDLAPISGTIVTAASGIVSFDHTSIAANAGSYLCRIKWTTATSTVGFTKRFLVPVSPVTE